MTRTPVLTEAGKCQCQGCVYKVGKISIPFGKVKRMSKKGGKEEKSGKGRKKDKWKEKQSQSDLAIEYNILISIINSYLKKIISVSKLKNVINTKFFFIHTTLCLNSIIRPHKPLFPPPHPKKKNVQPLLPHSTHYFLPFCIFLVN